MACVESHQLCTGARSIRLHSTSAFLCSWKAGQMLNAWTFFYFEKRKAPENSFGYPAFLAHVKTLILKTGDTTGLQ